MPAALRVEPNRLRDASRVERRPAETVRLLRAFAPIDKRALGIAFGLVCGLALCAITAFHVWLRPPNALPLELLAQYFYGYEVSWRGAIVALFWGFFTGFVAGWFMAFSRNLVMAIMVFIFKTR